MEGKINFDELSNSQRQLDDFLDNDFVYEPSEIVDDIRVRIEEEEDRYRNFGCKRKLLITLFYLIWGNCYLIIDSTILKDYIIPVFLFYIIIYIPFFFWLIFLNSISFILILIFIGYRRFILEPHDLYDKFLRKFIYILITPSLGTFGVLLILWKKYIRHLNTSIGRIIKVIVFFPCLIMSTIILFPQKILINR